jgi:hypothetical protein
MNDWILDIALARYPPQNPVVLSKPPNSQTYSSERKQGIIHQPEMKGLLGLV